jgi:hypothetical protein
VQRGFAYVGLVITIAAGVIIMVIDYDLNIVVLISLHIVERASPRIKPLSILEPRVNIQYR